jgi:hypothetical protein
VGVPPRHINIFEKSDTVWQKEGLISSAQGGAFTEICQISSQRKQSVTSHRVIPFEIEENSLRAR